MHQVMIARLASLLALGLLAVLMMAGAASAQVEQRKSPLGIPLPPASERAVPASPGAAAVKPAEPPGLLSGLWSWVLEQQQRLNRELAQAVKALKSGDLMSATLALALVAFTYGVLHAAGPGHGKAVISSYVLANERTVRRGILLSFIAAFIQALSAITIVGILAILLNATSLKIKAAEAWIETVSWGFVTLVGVWLLYGQLKPLLAGAGGHRDAHDHGHSHDHAHAHAPAPEAGGACAHAGCGHHHHDHHHHHSHHDHAAHHAHHDHDHDHQACCGHSHMPSPKDLEGQWSWRKAMALAFSVGIRPCTGAILVLLFAMSQGMLWAGIFATFAMALGTAITVSALAALAVGSKELAKRMAGGGESPWARRVEVSIGLLGSLLVLLMGLVFFVGSLKGASAPF